MGFGDKLKDLREQARGAVAEHKEQIQNAVEVASVAANEKTQGRYASKIAKFGEKATGAVDRFGADGVDAAPSDGSASEPESVFTAPSTDGPAAAFADAAPDADSAPPRFADDAPAESGSPGAASDDDGFPKFDE